MKLVDRHLSGEFLRYTAAAEAAFVTLFLVITFFEKLRFFLKNHAAVGDAALFLAAKLPWIVSQTLPLAALLGTLLSLTVLSRHGEITAFRCGGVSLGRLARPYLACGLALSAATAFVQEVVTPAAASFGREVQEVRIRKKSAQSLSRTGDLWLRAGQRFVHVKLAVPDEDRLVSVSLVERDGRRVVRRIDAGEARWTGGRWVLRDVEVRTFDALGVVRTERSPELFYDLGQPPEDFRVAKLDPQELPWTPLRRLVLRYRAQGLGTRDLEVGLWAKTSIPFACVVMPLLGFPLALRAGRRRGSSHGVALGVGVGFCYWLLLAAGLSLGKVGAVPPLLGAWLGNLVFGALGFALLRRAERVGQA